MTLGPRTPIEFREMFRDEDVCWAHPRAVRWPDGYRCPACQHSESSWLSRRRLEQCRACRRRGTTDLTRLTNGPAFAVDARKRDADQEHHKTPEAWARERGQGGRFGLAEAEVSRSREAEQIDIG